MVGLVIVSHSADLAEAVRALAEKMVQPAAPIAVAGGIDDPENPFGTDATRVHAAIEEVYSPDGVLVLMDLGSAILSAETALEFLSEDQRAHVRLCEAPLVEGTLAAAIQAAAGGSLDQVLSEALAALTAKTQHLSPSTADHRPPTTDSRPSAVSGQPSLQHSARLTIHNPAGLHARPAAQFVTTANRFQAEIQVQNATQNRGPANAKSINAVATLGVRQGDDILITAAGPDAPAALAALAALVQRNFNEPSAVGAVREPPNDAPHDGVRAVREPPLQPSAASQPPISNRQSPISGLPASPGIAIGRAHLYSPAAVPFSTHPSSLIPQQEWVRLQAALARAAEQIHAQRQQTAARVGEAEAAIFDAHALFLQDPELLEAARQRIFGQGEAAETAWQATTDAAAARFRALDNEYLQARAADVTDVARRVLRLMAGETTTGPTGPVITEPAILITEDLTPSDTAQLDPAKVLGICTALGGATAHSAILARALGIPAVVALGRAILDVPGDTLIALDGRTGRVWTALDDATRADLERQQAAWQQSQQEARRTAGNLAATRDGRRVEVAANIGGPADARAAIVNGAEGVGLFRTEFLFLDRATAPTEDEQIEAYCAVGDIMGDRPVVIRTLDVGGDKPLPYIHAAPEANPFLGLRGLRLCLAQPDLLKTQFRAILRASPGRRFKIMFPMVATVAEVRAARAIVEEVRQELRQAGIPFDEDVEIGIMIEIPAAALLADQLAAEVAFFSLGSNDLSQYTLAADRTNAAVAALADPLHPAVLRLIQQTVQAAHAAGIWVGLCGEVGGNPLATPLLVGLGLDELSMAAPAIPTVKQVIASLTTAEAQAVAAAALEMEDAAAVTKFLANG